MELNPLLDTDFADSFDVARAWSETEPAQGVERLLEFGFKWSRRSPLKKERSRHRENTAAIKTLRFMVCQHLREAKPCAASVYIE